MYEEICGCKSEKKTKKPDNRYTLNFPGSANRTNPPCCYGNETSLFDVTHMFILCTGEPVESEGHDRPDLELPGQQLQLLKDAVTFSEFYTSFKASVCALFEFCLALSSTRLRSTQPSHA